MDKSITLMKHDFVTLTEMAMNKSKYEEINGPWLLLVWPNHAALMIERKENSGERERDVWLDRKARRRSRWQKRVSSLRLRYHVGTPTSLRRKIFPRSEAKRQIALSRVQSYYTNIQTPNLYTTTL
uniref:Uncharacterized protein n=1 Tax=Oryza punctata TaxID=4537 RepID=A0A0E0LER8_ORYPU